MIHSVLGHSQVSLFPNTLQSLYDGVAARSESVTVSHLYRALQHSIERDKDRTTSFMIFIVSDKQRWNFITPSWHVASYSVYEGTSVLRAWLFWWSIHRAQLLEISRHQIPRLQVQTLTIVFHIESIVVIPQIDHVILKRVARIGTRVCAFS